MEDDDLKEGDTMVGTKNMVVVVVVVVVDGLLLSCGGIPVRMASGRTSLISVPSPEAALNRAKV